jgi:hypothetical protein
MPPRKAKAQNKPRPPPTSVPLLSPKIWMANDFEPESVSIPRMRAILDFNQVTDSYYRRFQQTALFKEKVTPKVKVDAVNFVPSLSNKSYLLLNHS